ncbi:MAG: DNA polymerase IV, partial [Pseudomonadota bacterium]
VAARLSEKGYSGRTVVLKMKTSDFQILTRNRQLPAPTQRADLMMAAAAPLIRREADGRRFRLIGIGVSDLTSSAEADPPDLFAPAVRSDDA